MCIALAKGLSPSWEVRLLEYGTTMESVHSKIGTVPVSSNTYLMDQFRSTRDVKIPFHCPASMVLRLAPMTVEDGQRLFALVQ